MRKGLCIIRLSLMLLLLISTKGMSKQYNLYLDADFNTAKESSIAIQQGINTALAEVGYKIQGHQFNLVVKDHHANPLVSRENLTAFINDPNGLAVFSGLHSPPLLSNKYFINHNRILLLDPWAAAAEITRSDTSQNWIFRLSIDDTNAAEFLIHSAMKQGYRKPYLLLEDTQWGRSNFDNITQVINREAITTAGVSWFPWQLKQAQADDIVQKITHSQADIVIYIGNAEEGKTFTHSVISKGDKFVLPILSHWGITGGDYFDIIARAQQHDLALTFIQTKFAFTNPKQSAFARKVLHNAITYNSAIKHRADIKSPIGFIHAYDLTRIFIAAVNQAGLTGDRNTDKQAIHHALEHLQKPVQGLIKQYVTPFSEYSKFNPNAHEALSVDDYRLGHYDKSGEVYLIEAK